MTASSILPPTSGAVSYTKQRWINGGGVVVVVVVIFCVVLIVGCLLARKVLDIMLMVTYLLQHYPPGIFLYHSPES